MEANIATRQEASDVSRDDTAVVLTAPVAMGKAGKRGFSHAAAADNDGASRNWSFAMQIDWLDGWVC